MKNVWFGLTFLICLVMAGCGGGGSGNDSNLPPGGVVTANVFLTDAPLPSYDKVWARIYRIETVGSNGSTEPVFIDEDGLTVDLASLNRSGESRYLYLGKAQVNNDSKAVRVTMAEKVAIVPRGGGTLLSRTIAGATQAKAVVEYQVNRPVRNGNLIVDFDLSKWTEEAGKITPVIQNGSDTGISNPERHVRHDYTGTISGMTGTDKVNFNMAQQGLAVSIQVNDQTTVTSDDGAFNPQFGNGSKVRVTGVWDAAQKVVVAQWVRIQKSRDLVRTQMLEGRVLNVEGDVFTVRLDRANGLFPAQTNIVVDPDDTVLFVDRSGMQDSKEIFYQHITAQGQDVEIDGTYNPANNTFLPVLAKSIDLKKVPDTHIRGLVGQVNASAKTFVLETEQWMGAYTVVGSNLNVKPGTDARYQNRAGDVITADQFFDLLAASSRVGVTGTTSNGTLTARMLRIR